MRIRGQIGGSDQNIQGRAARRRAAETGLAMAGLLCGDLLGGLSQDLGDRLVGLGLLLDREILDDLLALDRLGA